MIYPPIVDFDALFQAFDLDENGSVTMAELEAWKDMCANSNENDECPLPIDARSILNVLYPYIDFDGNGIITKDEVLLIYPAVEEDVLSQYHLTLDQVIMILDRNHDSGISIDELISMIELSGYDLDNVLGIIDHNGDSMISYEEVSDYVSDDIFAYLDVNGNGLIDCNDLNTITIPPIDWEG
ncbi:MAG TPA: EF-hand domain-containing protein, partial [Candidatus Hydrogenedens sp.]|nr:EF-hand domain-containing protein [Candidatus Hydrogenedens sp.]